MNVLSDSKHVLFATASLLALFFVGCGRSDLATRADLQKVEQRLDDLLGNPESRQTLRRLTEEAATANESELERLTEQQRQLQNQLPVLAGIELSQELGDLDWLLSIRRSLSNNANAFTLADAESLLSEVPPTLEHLAPKLAADHAAQTMKLAESLVKDDQADFENVEQVQAIVQRIKADKETEAQWSNMVQRLDAKLKSLAEERLVNELNAESIAIEGQLENLSKISDADLRRTAFLGLSQMVDSIRVRFASQGISDAELTLSKLHFGIEDQLTESLEELSDSQRRRSEKARMKYQAWALGEIQKLEKMFASEGWFENNYQKKHDAAVEHLLPINQAMLEPPVAKFYNEAFETIWQAIEDGDGMQLSLARKTAEVPKRSLDSFMEKAK